MVVNYTIQFTNAYLSLSVNELANSEFVLMLIIVYTSETKMIDCIDNGLQK